MAGKRDKSPASSPSPFSVLKGLAVSPPPAGKKVVPPPAPRRDVDDTPADFASAMADLGVKPITPGSTAPPVPAADPVPGLLAPPPLPPPTEEELFLSALNGITAVFRDELPAEVEPQASPRRMKLVRQGKLFPEATLDLHGLTRDEARLRTRHFLDNSVHHGFKTVLLITGRGLRSPEGPVLRDELERYLSHDAAAWVAEWGRAPGNLGGEGALVVFLKGRKGGGE
ncbi:MAG: hypothetical protein A2091_07745 [Desulfuromonadales bacterium GWD2_61_12]|nr:MAG: hypothetical protein A2091_07745 [Desulfuromonadales bacterium GWD2_61_12]HBT82891.1 hypothetical protein [Desulfuromonas sp.]